MRKRFKKGALYDQVLNLHCHLNVAGHGNEMELQRAAKAFWKKIKKGGEDGNKDDTAVHEFLQQERTVTARSSPAGFFTCEEKKPQSPKRKAEGPAPNQSIDLSDDTVQAGTFSCLPFYEYSYHLYGRHAYCRNTTSSKGRLHQRFLPVWTGLISQLFYRRYCPISVKVQPPSLRMPLHITT